MKLNFLKSFNVIFFVLLLNINCSNKCTYYKEPEAENINKKVLMTSLKNKEKVYFLFFTNREDNFKELKELASKVNTFFFDILSIEFYCKKIKSTPVLNIRLNQHLKYDTNEVRIIKDGKNLETKKIRKISEQFLNQLLERYQVNKTISKKTKDLKKTNILLQKAVSSLIKINNSAPTAPNFLEISSEVELQDKGKSKFKEPHSMMELAEIKLDKISATKMNNGVFVLVEQHKNRFWRFVISIVMVLLISVVFFLFVKNSIDWAQSSKSALLSMREVRLEEVVRDIKENQTYNGSQFYDS